jgi:hypothetical protein
MDGPKQERERERERETIETTDLNTEQRSSRRPMERAICLRVTRDAWVSVRALRARRAGADTGCIAEPRDLRGSVFKSVASVVLRSSGSEARTVFRLGERTAADAAILWRKIL